MAITLLATQRVPGCWKASCTIRFQSRDHSIAFTLCELELDKVSVGFSFSRYRTVIKLIKCQHISLSEWIALTISFSLCQNWQECQVCRADFLLCVALDSLSLIAPSPRARLLFRRFYGATDPPRVTPLSKTDSYMLHSVARSVVGFWSSAGIFYARIE